MPARLRRAVALLVAAVVVAPMVAVASASPVAAAAAGDTSPSLQWRRCGNAQCATLPVPLDDTNPTSRLIDLALVRIRATDRSRRIGALVINPGGPGVPAVSFVRQFASVLPDAIRSRFDIVGFDPRGVGRSTHVDCSDNLEQYWNLDFAASTPESRAALVAGVRQFVAACEARSADLLPYLSTERTVRDLDRVRSALKEPKISFLGFSYGTLLGARYADRFPHRVRAAVLDGGMSAWLRAGGPVESGAAAVPEGDFEARPRDDDTVGAAELRRRLDDPGLALLDARAPERFAGEREPIDPVAGHVPGARNVPFAELAPEGRYLAPDHLRARLEGDGGEIVAYCGSGVTACILLLAAEVAGLPAGRLYPGSWSEWSGRGLPVETGR